MAMREPLPGWTGPVYGRVDLKRSCVNIYAWYDGEWQVRIDNRWRCDRLADDLPSAQLAAEDAARAMVADMAAALGGRVTWAKEGGG